MAHNYNRTGDIMTTVHDLEKKYEIDIMVCSRDRHTEVTLLMESLRKQTFQKWNLIFLDDASGTPFQMCGFGQMVLNRLKFEGHKIKYLRNNMSYGVCYARNLLIEEQIKWKSSANLTLRCDDDVILDADYIERLVRVIDSGYDMASGVVPLVAHPLYERENSFIGPIINEHILDEEGNLVSNNDDCGYGYLSEGVLPTHQFRTNCLYKTEIHNKIKYPSHLTTVGFREEGFFSFSAILEGYTIGVDVQAVVYHFQTPSGGVRCDKYSENIQLDDESFKKWIKEKFEKHGNFLLTYNEKLKTAGLLK